ncbi:glycoside hydrolase TIM-barrel-like domain-containing protein [soil metagenome]
MATLVLSAVGQAVGGPVGAGIGSVIGSLIDRAAISALTPAKQVGQRVTGLQVESSADGAPMAVAFGRARLAGQVIWAARFRERRVEQATGGGKGGPKAYSYAYSLSFAVALCEGPIDGVGRVWADGQPMDLSGATMRVHRGADDQAPDALIEAVESAAPAYRGVAYLVFEDLALDAWGGRPPQIAAEVFRRPGAGGLEDKLTSVCLIPGAGEFVYATEPVLRRDGLTKTTAENVNNTSGHPDLILALDQLQAQLPNMTAVTLVVAWFGDDLRAGVGRVRPGVDQAAKITIPQTWSVAGLQREDAHLISTHDGGPAYGGTPSDASVLQCIAELKARGLAVTLYPFLMMDVPPRSGRADPYGGAEQAAYPWRGRITCHPAPGRPGSPDGSSEAAAEVAAFFGSDADFGFRRMVLHCVGLAVQAGGVDGLLIGSELRGLTTVRGAGGTYPAVSALRTLAADCRAVLGDATQIGYAADWSEYFGHQPPDGSRDVTYHLDPLWAHEAIDFVGVDFYPPLTDWRDGADHLDAQAGFAGPHDPAYLAAHIAGGEDFDWYYASPADRAAQVRSPITDGTYGEPWVFRPKDFLSWWSNPHHDRPGGVRSSSPTAWVPGSKPIRLVEFGCPAVDKGANSPNLFVDAKSAESGLPPFSNGGRDDRAQRTALEAVLDHFADAAANPVSSVYGGPMVQAMSAWCWDARPFPDFPARAGVWADAPNWTLGHWLTGRMGPGSGGAVAAEVLARYGVEDADVSGATGSVDGYVIAAPATGSEALEPLAATLGFDAAERGGRVALVAEAAGDPAHFLISQHGLAMPDETPPLSRSRMLAPTPDLVRVRFIDGAADYQSGSATVRADEPGGAGPADLSLPVVMGLADAEAVARRRLTRTPQDLDTLSAHVSPAVALAVEVGDEVRVEGVDGLWRVLRVDLDEQPRLSLASLAPATETMEAEDSSDWRPAPAARPAGPPVLHLLDLPPLDGFEDDARPVVAVASDPWRGAEVTAGPSLDALTSRASVSDPATVGRLLAALPPGPCGRWSDGAALELEMEGASLSSASEAAVLAGANVLAVQGASGEWEVLQFADAAATGA